MNVTPQPNPNRSAAQGAYGSALDLNLAHNPNPNRSASGLSIEPDGQHGPRAYEPSH